LDWTKLFINNKGVNMDNNLLEEFKQIGIFDLISEIGKLTDEELEALVFAHKSGNVGIA
tara:strand:- start:401 stop:577 length:177 start_codon:yes stop_codon:yes gene_type:complete